MSGSDNEKGSTALGEELLGLVPTAESLAEREALGRLLFEMTPQGVVCHDATGVIAANPAAQRMLGLRVDQLQGHLTVEPAWRFVHEDGSDFPRDEQPGMVALRTAREVRDVVGVVNAEGSTCRWLNVTAKPLFRPGESAAFRSLVFLDDITELKKVEDALRRSEVGLCRAQTAAHMGSWTWAPKTNRLEWSDEMYRVFGIDKAGFTGDLADVIARAIHPDDRQKVDESNLAVRRDGRPAPLEYRVIWPDQSVHVIWAEAGEATLDESGSVVTLSGYAQDITERKRIEEALRSSEEEWRSLFAVLPVGVSILDEHQAVKTFNPALAAMLDLTSDGLREGAYRQRRYLRLDGTPMPPEEFPSVRAQREQRTIRAVPIGVIKEDGSSVWTEVSAAPLFLPNASCVTVTTDITERRTLEDAVQRERTFIASVLDTVPVGVVTVDAAGLVTSANQRAVSILGLRKDDPLRMTYGAPVWRILALDGSPFPEDRLPFSVVMATGRPVFGVQHAIHWPNGKRVVLSVNAAPVFDEQGRVAGMTASIEDITELERGEVEQRRSAERFSAAFGVSPYAKAITRLADGVILDVNDAFVVATGFSRDEAVGNTSARLDLWVDPAERSRVIKEPSMDGKTVEGELELRRKDGEIRVVQFSAVPMTAANEVHILMNLHDITEHKRTQLALHESQQRLQCILDNASLLVYVKDLEGRLTLVNRALETLLGLPREQLLGKTSHELMSIEDADAHRANDLVAMATGKPVVAEERNEEADGPHTYLSTKFSLFDLAGKMTGVCGISIDVTERKQAEESYGTLFREMLDGFALHEMIYDAEGRPVDYRFLAVNPAFERMTGLKADTIRGRTVLEVMPATESHWIEAYGRVVLSGEPLRFESYAAALKKHFEVKAFRPAPRQFVCIFTDVTERKTSEAEKSILEDQLHQAQKMEAVGRLAGGVAHDFNNMLGAILGHVEMAMEDVDSTQALYADLQEIQTAARRSADLTRQLLAFARKQTVAPKVLELNQTVEGMLKMLHRLIGEDIDLTWRPDADLWSVKLDPSQIDQILANLCVNARDAIADVGKITIETENSRFDQDYCANHAGYVVGDYVQLAVSDNGCGMDKATLAQLFEPFFTTKEMGKGTGLGLATVYGIVKQNSGFINVYSEPGHGTTFKVYLPRHVGDDSVAVERTATLAARGNETILVVEDEPSLLNMTKRILERLGYTVVTASTPGEAICLAREYPCELHLLVTDVVMPEMNGRGLAKQLQSLFPGLKCLFMSGYTADVIAHHGVLDEGVNFVQKPFSKEDLAAKVREALDGGNVAGAVIVSPDTALLDV